MILFNILGILLAVLMICFGLYYLVFKEFKNRNSFIIGYLYSILGGIGLVVVIINMIWIIYTKLVNIIVIFKSK